MPNCKGHGENEFYNIIEHILSCLFPHLALTSLWGFFSGYSLVYIFLRIQIYTHTYSIFTLVFIVSLNIYSLEDFYIHLGKNKDLLHLVHMTGGVDL